MELGAGAQVHLPQSLLLARRDTKTTIRGRRPGIRAPPPLTDTLHGLTDEHDEEIVMSSAKPDELGSEAQHPTRHNA